MFECYALQIIRFIIGFCDKLSRKGLPLLLEFDQFGFGLKDKGFIMGYLSFVGACTQVGYGMLLSAEIMYVCGEAVRCNAQH